MYLNDLLEELRLEKSDNDVILSNVLIAHSQTELQRLIDIVKRWCSKWKPQVNLEKTKVVQYQKARKGLTKHSFNWGQENIEISKGYCYLGVFLDQYLNFNVHCDDITSAAGRALRKNLSKFAAFKNIGYYTFTKLFKT